MFTWILHECMPSCSHCAWSNISRLYVGHTSVYCCESLGLFKLLFVLSNGPIAKAWSPLGSRPHGSTLDGWNLCAGVWYAGVDSSLTTRGKCALMENNNSSLNMCWKK